MSTNDILNFVFLPILSICMAMVFIRFLIGPRITDRVISLDLIVTIGIAMMAIYAITSEQEAFLDIATIFALIAFLGTTAFAYYIEKKG